MLAPASHRRRRYDDERQERPNRDDAKPNERLSGSRLVFVVLTLVPGIFLSFLDLRTVTAAIPGITDELRGLDDVS